MSTIGYAFDTRFRIASNNQNGQLKIVPIINIIILIIIVITSWEYFEFLNYFEVIIIKPKSSLQYRNCRYII